MIAPGATIEMTIAFACPAFNEESSLRTTVQRTLSMVDHLVIVDDGSTDRTGAVADELAREHLEKVSVIHLPTRRGVGFAVKSAFRALLERGGVDAMGVITADDQWDPSLVDRFREVLETMPEVDVAKGSRFMHHASRSRVPALRRLGDRGLSTVLQITLGYWGMDDVLHGYFLARTDVIRQMDLDAVADGPELENTMMAELRRLRATFALVPSPSSQRDAASSGVDTKITLRRTVATVGSMVARRAVRGPDRLGLALLLMSVPTLGVTLPAALMRTRITSPRVQKLR